MMIKLLEKLESIYKNLRIKSVRVNTFDEISREIRGHIQNLKDKGIDVNINNDQVNDLVYKILKGIGKIDSTPQDSTPQDLSLKSFLSKYEELIETFYSSDIFGKRKIDTKEINNALANKKVTGNEFCKYIMFLLKSLMSLVK